MEQIRFRKREQLDFRATEAFKALRTNILFCGDNIKVIGLTSSTPDEGKTSVSVQLATSFAEAGKRVLLIDADIRKSVIMGRYRINKEVFGLTHYLTRQRGKREVIYNTNIPGMDIIIAGPVSPNPTELLSGRLFEQLLQSERDNYDYIIVDAPPLGSVIDAAIIAKHIDGAIIVVESGAISYKLAQNVKSQLEKSECRILGVVLNKMDLEKNGYYGSYYGKYYGKNYGNYGDYGN